MRREKIIREKMPLKIYSRKPRVRQRMWSVGRKGEMGGKQGRQGGRSKKEGIRQALDQLGRRDEVKVWTFGSPLAASNGNLGVTV